MSWADAAQLESQLKDALDTFNWPEAEAMCNRIIDRLRSDPELPPEATAETFLYDLRRKQGFTLMIPLADTLLQAGLRTPQLLRQYAQALIDQGLLTAPEMVLQSIMQDSRGIKSEELEARGLMGRIYKQLYVNNNDPRSPKNRANLERALNEYLYVYRLSPQDHLWHGINVVALLDRARRDDFPMAGLPDAASLAHDILAAIQERERQSPEPLTAWDVATRLEAHVALGHHTEAADTALRYIHSIDADAFEINSTIRQLTELWQLHDRDPPGSHLLPILKAGHLNKRGAAIQREPQQVTEEAAAIGGVVEDLETIFVPDRMTALEWYKKGLEQCHAVARVERLNGQGHGTGWLVQASDFFPAREGVLVLTNAHVISPTSIPGAILPEDSRIHFQARGEIFEVDTVVWTCPPTKLDATLLTLKGKPSAEPLRLHKRAMEMSEIASRLYIIGHPGGHDLAPPFQAGERDSEFSLLDICLLANDESRFRYRMPSGGISSGSPVFEPEDWRVVAIHHKGSEVMPRIDGPADTYRANEGISLWAIVQATSGRGVEPIPMIRSGLKGEPPAQFYFAFESEACRGTFVQYGANVDLIFNYAPPPADALAIIKASGLDQVRTLQLTLGILVMPIGFTFRGEGDSGYRQMRFYQGGTTSDKVRFELRAMDELSPKQAAGSRRSEESLDTAPKAGFHVIFDLRGYVLYQFFLPAQLVHILPESEEGMPTPPPLTFDLDQLKRFDDHAVKAQERMAAALQKVLS